MRINDKNLSTVLYDLIPLPLHPSMVVSVWPCALGFTRNVTAKHRLGRYPRCPPRYQLHTRHVRSGSGSGQLPADDKPRSHV